MLRLKWFGRHVAVFDRPRSGVMFGVVIRCLKVVTRKGDWQTRPDEISEPPLA